MPLAWLCLLGGLLLQEESKDVPHNPWLTVAERSDYNATARHAQVLELLDAMDIRTNAQGLDLNRDYMKLESPEVAAMVRFLDCWDPSLVIDLHTTNGSWHRYDLTWSPPLNPSGPEAPLALVRDRQLPDVARRLAERASVNTFAYGNFSKDHQRWESYSSLPRFGTQYHGLRGIPSVLSEAYSKLPFERRVFATREFVREILDWTAGHAEEVRQAIAMGREQTIHRGGAPEPRDQVGIRHRLAAAEQPVRLAGWVERSDAEGHVVSTGEPRDYEVRHFDHFEPVAFCGATVGLPGARSEGRSDRRVEALRDRGPPMGGAAARGRGSPGPSVDSRII